ncbi:hypothetical protein SAMN04515668_4725 [Hymenobacter arizonensis]|uniref:Uncharacterized protein n=2 Tax=Hymenobacter arizonensis TaxID=1227077 RepID=A0A1I6BMD3_HYMAR|nr:hypothetical protein SAMN04515668_4725 [Hymenobacter arizonensis]
MQAVLEHPQVKETTKLKRIAELVAGALAGEDARRRKFWGRRLQEFT